MEDCRGEKRVKSRRPMNKNLRKGFCLVTLACQFTRHPLLNVTVR